MSLKVKIRNSITFRITGWLFLVMTVLMILTFAVFRLVSGSILQKTIRGYLLSSVNENTNKIAFYQDREQADDNDLNDVYIRYKDGWLEIDDDFLDEINDVQSALYTSDGTMLYGKNPIARLMEKEAFTTSRVYRYMAGGGDRYFVYDRKLNGTAMEDLWIRGVVPLWSEERQIEDIFRTSIFFVPVLLLAGIAGTYVTVRQSLMPVKRIEQTASEISRGTDLARRIEIGEVDAELCDLAEAFNGMLDRLEHSFEAEQRFTSDASHELRTPMTVILTQTELALEKERQPEEYRRALSVILRQGRRMHALIASMLDYTRIEMRPENYPLTDIDLSELADSTARDMALIRTRNIIVTAQIQPGVRIRGNQLLLERALQNLIDNAYKYGKEEGHILVRLESKGCDKVSDKDSDKERNWGSDRKNDKDKNQGVILSVTDDGIGIPAEDQSRIFERFYRADSSRSSRNVFGAGLGLSMVRKIMEIHGGTVSVESLPRQGSTFYLVFAAESCLHKQI